MSAAVPMQPDLSGSTQGTKSTTYQWVLAWIMLIMLVALAGQTNTGYTIIYYALVLILVLLLVTQYRFIASAFAPIGQRAPA